MEEVKLRYRATCLSLPGGFHSQNFKTISEAESYILEEAVIEGGLKKAYILDRTFTPPKKIQIFNKKDFE